MMTNSQVRKEAVSTRDRIAMVLMLLAVVAAGYAFSSSVGAAVRAGPETQQVEWWRAISFLMFVGVFVLLAGWPRRYPFLWELVILNKAALTVVEIILIGRGAAYASETAVADGILVLVLIAAYLLSRGYQSWRGG